MNENKIFRELSECANYYFFFDRLVIKREDYERIKKKYSQMKEKKQ